MAEMTTTVAETHNGGICPFSSIADFADAQRMAKALASSSMVPDAFQERIAGAAAVPNCLIALELANRLQTSIFMIMQNMYVIHGRPAFSAQFVIASIQSCGRFSALKYRWTVDQKTGKKTGCRAYATELRTGEELEGSEITLEMAEKEGWSTKGGSKWKTMPEQMLRYRAASFFGRLYAPDIMMGIKTPEEIEDSTPAQTTAKFEPVATPKTAIEELNSLVEKKEPEPVTVEVVAVEDENTATVPKAEASMMERVAELKEQTKGSK